MSDLRPPGSVRGICGISGNCIPPPPPDRISSGLIPKNSISAPMISSVVMLNPPRPPIGIGMPPAGKGEPAATAAILDVVAFTVFVAVAHRGLLATLEPGRAARGSGRPTSRETSSDGSRPECPIPRRPPNLVLHVPDCFVPPQARNVIIRLPMGRGKQTQGDTACPSGGARCAAATRKTAEVARYSGCGPRPPDGTGLHNEAERAGAVATLRSAWAWGSPPRGSSRVGAGLRAAHLRPLGLSLRPRRALRLLPVRPLLLIRSCAAGRTRSGPAPNAAGRRSRLPACGGLRGARR